MDFKEPCVFRHCIFVIAGNYAQAIFWMRQHRLRPNRDARYVSDPRKLMGLPRGSTQYVLTGQYYDHPEIIDMLNIIRDREFIQWEQQPRH